MKRHISIFAFLLGAFAAGLAFEAGAATAQTIYGGYCYTGSQYRSDLRDQHMKVNDSFMPVTLSKPGDKAVCTATKPDGMRIADKGWGYVKSEDSSTTLEIMEFDNVTWDAKSSSEYEWKYDGISSGYVAIAVRFDYIKYTLKFASSQGGTMPADIATTYEESVTIPAPSSAPTGYHFVKWIATSSFDAGFSNDVLAGSSVNGEGFGLAGCHADGSVITLTAQWTVNGYSVSCELNGGSWSADYNPPTRVVYDTVFSLPAPTRIGYDFIGWKVTSGLDTTTAKWGTGENPSTPITTDTLCANGDKAVYFKNLNPTDNAAVTLTAQWQAKTITVRLNNDGGQGKSIIEPAPYYLGDYPPVDPPTRTGYEFKGYRINDRFYWDNGGQPLLPGIWDISTNCWAIAVWEKFDYQLIYDENRSDGVPSKQIVTNFEYNVAMKLYDGADFSNFGCTLLGWSTGSGATVPTYEIGGSATFRENTTLFAVWEKNYFIAYDGNGATAGEMAVQKFVIDKPGQVLSANAYARTGYGFLGWATNRTAAAEGKWQYANHAVLPQNFAAVLGQTNTLSATWDANTYCVAFDPNGGTGASMPVMPCKYDQPVMLPEATYDHGAYDFVGWSNDVAKVIYTDLTKSVSNLCATADGTNTLYAVWKLSPLSAAMHCDNLKWESYAYEGNEETYANKWRPKSNGEGVWQTGGDLINQQWLVAQVQTNGTLSFKWKPVGCEGQRYSLSYWITSDKDNYFDGAVDLKGADDEWHACVISNVPSQYYVHFYVGSLSDRSYCQIDQMTWMPGGPEPVDGKDNVTISSAAVSADGKSFSLSFKSDAQFDYNLLTNANLLIKEGWGVMEKKTGTGEPITFEPEIIEGQPQMFYRVDTIQKK